MWANMSALDRSGRPSTARILLLYMYGTPEPDQSGRPTDAITRLSSTMKPGKIRPTHRVDVTVVSTASTTAATPIAAAASRIRVRARGVVGNTSAMAGSARGD